MAKISGNKDQSKSKVKKPDSVLKLKEKNHSIVASRISSDKTIEVTFGNQMQLIKQEISFIDNEN